MSQEFRRVTSADVNAELQHVIEERLLAVLAEREPGHCMRVGDLDTAVMLAVARNLRQSVAAAAQVHVLSSAAQKDDPLLITSSKLVELRNPLAEGELRPPLLVFVPNDLRTAAEDSFAEATFEQVSVADTFKLLRTRLAEQLPESLRANVPDILKLLEDRNWRWADALAACGFSSASVSTATILKSWALRSLSWDSCPTSICSTTRPPSRIASPKTLSAWTN